MKRIHTSKDFKNVLKTSKENKTFVLKHSNTCPISAQAKEEIEAFEEEHDEYSFFYLVVQEDRPLSNKIEERFDIKHESPQLFIFDDEEVMWHDSHYMINDEEIQKQL